MIQCQRVTLRLHTASRLSLAETGRQSRDRPNKYLYLLINFVSVYLSTFSLVHRGILLTDKQIPCLMLLKQPLSEANPHALTPSKTAYRISPEGDASLQKRRLPGNRDAGIHKDPWISAPTLPVTMKALGLLDCRILNKNLRTYSHG